MVKLWKHLIKQLLHLKEFKIHIKGMTNEEKQLLNKFYLRQISEGDFLERYPVDLKKNEKHIYLSIKEAYDTQNGDDLGLALTLAVFATPICYTDEFVELLCLLLKAKWHYQHENIATMLQSIKSPKSIDTLYDTVLTKFDYLDYDDSIPLAVKCIHALGEINTEYAKEKLRFLAGSDLAIIKEKAKKQLYHYKR
jgi:hypothetical protein